MLDIFLLPTRFPGKLSHALQHAPSRLHLRLFYALAHLSLTCFSSHSHLILSARQIGVGHDFRNGTTGWKWKLTSAMQGATATDVNYKHTLPMFPGFDLRVGLNAEYCLPDLQG